MTRDSGLISQHTDYPQAIQELLDQLHQMQQAPKLATNPDDLEALERDIRYHTDRLGSLLVGHHLQASLDSEALQVEQDLLVSHWPKPLQNDGKVTVWVRTAQGLAVPVRVTYYRRKGTRRAGKCVCRSGFAGHVRPLHPDVGCRDEPVGGDAGLSR